MKGVPGFAARSPLVADAFRFAREAHEGARSHGETRVDHPTEVARLLDAAGYADHVVAAALLHDVVEDTATAVAELHARSGAPVATLVAKLTEDPGVEDYEPRKAALRAQAAGDREEAAAIFAADKLASARTLRDSGETAPPAKLDHYQRTLQILRDRHPEVPFLEELQAELDHLRDAARRGARGP